MFTIVASVWISAVSPSELAFKQSRAFIELAMKTHCEIVVPTLLTVEVAATIARRSPPIGRGGEIAALLRQMQNVRWISLDEAFSQRAAAVALQSQLRTGDAVYAAVAIENNCILVSLDNDHLTLLADAVKAMTPEKALTQIGTLGI